MGVGIEPVILLVVTLVFVPELVEIMEKHRIKNCPLRMSRTVNSRHSKEQ
jgi:hypothetical protein